MATPTFSVLTRIHRRPVQLRKCLSSLVSQEWTDLTLLAIQDDPADYKSREVLDQFRHTLSVVDVPVKGLGFPQCNLYFNYAIQTAQQGTWVLYLDDDNWIPSPSALQDLSHVILKERPLALLLKYALTHQGARIVLPSATGWGKDPENNESDSACICLPQEIAIQHKWGPGFYGDVDFVWSAFRSIPKERIQWVDRVFIEAQSGPQGGKGEY